MPHLDVTTLEVLDLVGVPVGYLFFRHLAQSYELAIALNPTPTHAFWLNLTGKDAFLTESMPLNERHRVLGIALDPAKVQVRVSSKAKPSQYQSHQRGRVLLNRDRPASITTASRTFAPDHQSVIRISTWQIEQLEQPGGMEFESWSLGFVGDAGEWVSVLDVGSQSSAA